MKTFVTLLVVLCGVGFALSGGVDNPVLDTTHTNYLSGDTEIVVTGDVRSGSNVLSIASTLARDSEVTAATSGVYSAAASGWEAADVTTSNGVLNVASFTYLPLAGGSGYAVVNAVTNNLALEWWIASNRWAFVERYGATTNVVFISPVR